MVSLGKPSEYPYVCCFYFPNANSDVSYRSKSSLIVKRFIACKDLHEGVQLLNWSLFNIPTRAESWKRDCDPCYESLPSIEEPKFLFSRSELWVKLLQRSAL